MSDFRMDTAFFENKKTVKLTRRLGDHGVLSLIRLFRYAAVHRTDGILTRMDSEDIEIAAGFTGEFGAFFAALRSIGWLDGSDPGPYSIHDWEEHNPWVAEAKAREEKARFNALVRHHGPEEAARRMPEYASSIAVRSKNASISNADSIHTAPCSDADSNATSMSCEELPEASVPAASMLVAGENDASSNAPFLSSPLLSLPILSKDIANTTQGSNPDVADSPPESAQKRRKLPLPKHSPEAFRAFYAAFPRAEDPADAAKAWDTVKPDEAEIEAISACLAPFGGKRLSKELAVRCKAPGPWLRARRWEATDPFPGLTIEARAGNGTSNIAATAGEGLMAKAAEIQSHLDNFAATGGAL